MSASVLISEARLFVRLKHMSKHIVRFMSANVDSKFDIAKEKLSTLEEDPGNDVKLKIYGLFKQPKVGKNTTKKPRAFNFAGQAKWSAWNSLGSMTKVLPKYQSLFIKAMWAKLILFNKMDESTSLTITCHSEEMKSTLENVVDDIAKNRDLKILSVDWSRDLSLDEIRHIDNEDVKESEIAEEPRATGSSSMQLVVDAISKLPKGIQNTIINASLYKGMAMLPAQLSYLFPLVVLIRYYQSLPESSRASLERNFNVMLRKFTKEVEERIGKENLKKQSKVVARGRKFATEKMNFLFDSSKKALERVVAKPQERSAHSKEPMKSGKHKVKESQGCAVRRGRSRAVRRGRS